MTDDEFKELEKRYTAESKRRWDITCLEQEIKDVEKAITDLSSPYGNLTEIKDLKLSFSKISTNDGSSYWNSDKVEFGITEETAKKILKEHIKELRKKIEKLKEN